MNKTLTLFILLIILLFASCTDNPVDPNNYAENEIYEVLFYDLLVNNYSGFTYNWGKIDTVCKAFYIEFYSATDSAYHTKGSPSDPATQLLEKFSGYPIPVKKGSECDRNNGRGVVDKITRETGLLFFSGPLEAVSINRVTVNAGWYYNGGNAGIYTYTIVKKENRWFVISKIMRWIS